ncbi:hypothetical protein Pst134EA_000326 [Puccinia striiformis f. sp. tritici]|uniref:hypothetical protein n=1 Tax=Puccinia striiformis f. sp. tritici TaxID=168172 RepID=UPI0020087DBE|nr:hypothetical protein Pst134EA_000326 [Puccinia striiformis f. sp. tritici]KAH9473252.1 hypothetical protein Pst134EA_000326 [Puccinia striiformis f. sp. tritici]
MPVNQSPPCQSESCRLQELYQLDRKQNPSTPASSDSNNPIIKDQILSSVCPLERVIKKKLESS